MRASLTERDSAKWKMNSFFLNINIHDNGINCDGLSDVYAKRKASQASIIRQVNEKSEPMMGKRRLIRVVVILITNRSHQLLGVKIFANVRLIRLATRLTKLSDG